MKTFTKAMTLLVILLFAGIGSKAQWVQEPNEAHPFYPVFFTASYGGKLWAVGNGGVASSADNGATWTNLTAVNMWAGGGGNSNREAVFNGSTIYVRTTTEGVFRTLDAGATWDLDTVGLGAGRQVDMIYNDGTTVFCTTNWPEYGFFKKTPAATSWTKVTGVSPILGMTKKGTRLFAFSASTLYSSTDGGSSWTTVGPVTTPTTYSGTPVHLIGSDLYCGSQKSTDDGATWSTLPYTGSAYYTDGTNYYIGFGPMGGSDSVAMTADGGATWTVTGGGGLNALVTSITKHNGALYASVWSRGQLIKNGTNSASAVRSVVTAEENNAFPNPSTGIFNIAIPEGEGRSISVFNLTGEKVYETTANSTNLEINLSSVPEGTYLYQVTGNNSMLKSGKLVLRK